MRKKIILIPVLFIILTIIVKYKIVCATDVQNLQDKKSNLQNDINKANEQMSDIKIELTANLKQLNELEEKIANYESQIKDLDVKLEKIQKNVDKVAKKLENVKLDYNIQRKVLERRLVASYEAGETRYLDVLLSSASVSEFISNYYLLSEVVEYDKELLDNIERERNSIETIQKNLDENRKNLITIKENKEKTAIALENNKVLRSNYIAKLTEAEKKTQEKIDAFQTDLNQVENQILLATVGKVGEDYIGGELAWPAPGFTTVTSPFGYRIHPIFKVNRMHTGTDIAMNMGATIIAANDGIVTRASYSNSYGNMVIIDHGGGVSTVYGHGSEIVAQTGQEVKRGDEIMKAGSTGWSTGPHLHFEVRIDGKFVDPLPYITHKASLDNTEEDAENNTNENVVE